MEFAEHQPHRDMHWTFLLAGPAGAVVGTHRCPRVLGIYPGARGAREPHTRNCRTAVFSRLSCTLCGSGP